MWKWDQGVSFFSENSCIHTDLYTGTEKNVTQGMPMANTTPAAPQIASFADIAVTGYWMTLQGSK